MKTKSFWFVWVMAIIALAALPAFGCANHPPQKASTETSSSSSPGASFSSNTLGGGLKIIQSKTSNSGTRSFTEGFFKSAPPSDGANQYTDDWTSAIP